MRPFADNFCASAGDASKNRSFWLWPGLHQGCTNKPFHTLRTSTSFHFRGIKKLLSTPSLRTRRQVRVFNEGWTRGHSFAYWLTCTVIQTDLLDFSELEDWIDGLWKKSNNQVEPWSLSCPSLQYSRWWIRIVFWVSFPGFPLSPYRSNIISSKRRRRLESPTCRVQRVAQQTVSSKLWTLQPPGAVPEVQGTCLASMASMASMG